MAQHFVGLILIDILASVASSKLDRLYYYMIGRGDREVTVIRTAFQ